MTDVIGTADPDAPSRRHRRVPRWLTWGAAGTVVVAAIVVPAARNRLADHAASWLRDEWTRASSYDDARFAAIETVAARAGVLDDKIVEQAAAKTDVEEAGALQGLSAAMARHRMWSSDGDRARDAAVAALRFKIAGLRRDSAAAHPITGYLFISGYDALAARAATRVGALARHRGLPTEQQPAAVTLAPDRASLAQLRRTTDFPTGLSLLVASPNKPEIVDLDTGQRTLLPLPHGDSEVHSWSGRIMVISGRGVQAYDAAGKPAAHFSTGFVQLLSGTGDTLWVSGQRGVRRYAPDGHPLTPWIALPPGRNASAAVADVVVLAHTEDEATLIGETWDPMTGQRHLLPTRCFGGWAAAARTIVALPCGGDHQIVTVDPVNGAVRHFRLSRPVDEGATESLGPLSPTGRLLAVNFVRHGVQPGLLDLRTGHFLPAPGDGTLAPDAWSTDGRWVLLADEGSFGNGGRPRVALWRPSDGRTTSIRLATGDSLFGGLELLTTRSR